MFEWDDVKYFLAVARHGSTLAAAKAMDLSQSTVQRRVAELERGGTGVDGQGPPVRGPLGGVPADGDLAVGREAGPAAEGSAAVERNRRVEATD